MAPAPDPPAPALPPHYDQLGLSEKQTDLIRKVAAAYRSKIDALQRQIDDLNKAEAQDLENVLTPDQKAALRNATTTDKPARRAPSIPALASSTTMHLLAGTPTREAANRNTSGSGLPRCTSSADTMP